VLRAVRPTQRFQAGPEADARQALSQDDDVSANFIWPHLAAFAMESPWRSKCSKRGADDESEMGAFHDLFQPQREANLLARLDEFTPAGMDVGIIHAS